MTDLYGRRGLGRGISALLGDAPPASVVDGPAAATAATEIPIELIRRNPDQPRQHFTDDEMGELIASVKEKGVLQPILVRPAPDVPGEYQIVAGERRWRAAQAVRLRTIPAVVKVLDDGEVLEIGIVENVQRADLNALEEAQGYQSLVKRFGRTQDQVAATVGKSRVHVANALRLLSLPERVREHIVNGRLTAGHARAIATSPEVEQLADRIVSQRLSVRQAEELGRMGAEPRASGRARARAVPQPAPIPATKDPDTLALEQDLSSVLGLEVCIDDQGGAGELRLRYSSLEQLDDLCRRLSEE